MCTVIAYALYFFSQIFIKLIINKKNRGLMNYLLENTRTKKKSWLRTFSWCQTKYNKYVCLTCVCVCVDRARSENMCAAVVGYTFIFVPIDDTLAARLFQWATINGAAASNKWINNNNQLIIICVLPAAAAVTTRSLNLFVLGVCVCLWQMATNKINAITKIENDVRSHQNSKDFSVKLAFFRRQYIIKHI